LRSLGSALSSSGWVKTIKWMDKTIKAMKGTVDAQEKTIRAQADRIGGMETLVKTTETVLKFTDVEGTLKRMKAYKEMAELELEAWKKQTEAERKELTAELEEERKKAAAGSEELDAAMLQLADTETGLYGLAIKIMPYIPKDQRDELMTSLELGRARRVLLFLRHIAATAPDLSIPTTSGAILAHLAGFGPATPTIGADRGDASVTQPPTP
jgi:hypothetical protein